ncbi:MAG: hypothetical protein ABIR47_14615 [Candidatus Kapaibacterium sp.]
MQREEIMRLVQQLVRDAGGGKLVAEKLGVSPGSISQALRRAESRYDGTRLKIIRDIGGYDIEEVPHWLIAKRPIVEPPKSKASEVK